MTEETPNPPRKRRWLRWTLVVLLAVVLLGLWYLSSDAFEQSVRTRLVEGLETATGGKVELGRFHWSLWDLQMEAGDLTIRGREPAGEAPLLHADRVLVRVKVLSFLERQVGLQEVVVEKPVIHIVTFPDGTTNVGGVQRAPSDRSPVAALFDLELERLTVSQGELRWNQERIPFDLSAEDVSALLRRSSADQYSGTVIAQQARFSNAGRPALAAAVNVEFQLGRASLQVSSLKADSEGSKVEMSGKLENFDAPQADFAYSADLAAREIGATISLPPLRAGRVMLEGKGSYGKEGVASSGKLRWSSLAWQSGRVRLAGLNGGSEFSLNSERLVASRIFAQLWGGTTTGRAEITHWTDWSKAGPQAGWAKLQLANLEAGRMAESVANPAMPLDRLRLAGTASGTVNFAWKGTPESASAELALEVAPPLFDDPNQLPLAGSVKGVYRAASGTLDLEPSWLAARKTRVEAAGTFGAPGKEMQWKVATGDLAELLPSLQALGVRLPVELEPRGHASFTGSSSGRLSAFRASGKVAAFGVEFLFPQTPRAGTTAPSQPMTLRADSLAFFLYYSPERMEARNGTWTQGKARLDFEFGAALQDGRFNEQTPLSARLDLHDADLTDLQAIVGVSYPLTGRVDMALSLAGPWRALTGAGNVRVAQGTLFDEPFSSLTSSLKYNAGELELMDMSLAQNGSRVEGDLAWRFSDERFRFDLKGSGFELAKLARLQNPRWSLAGQAEFTAQGSGSAGQPQFGGTLKVRNLVLNGEEAGDFEADAVTRGEVLHLTARSHFQQAELSAEGKASLRGDWPAEISLRFAELDVDPLLRTFFKGRLTGHSRIAGTGKVTGPLRRPRELSIEATVDQLALDVENVQLQNQGPLLFSISNQTLDVRSFHIVGDSTNFSAWGKVGLAGERQLDLEARGGLDLRLLQSLDPDVQSQGTTTLSVVARGTMANPQLQGKMAIANGAISFIDVPNALSDINGELMFNENRLQVQSLSARTGGGRLDLGGYITYARGLYFNLTAVGEDIRLRYPPGISSVADADLRFVGSAAGSILSGEITVTRFGVSPGFDLAAFLTRARLSPGIRARGSAMESLRLDVRVVSTPELQVETSLARLSGDLDLRLRGTAAHPAILGRVNMTEGRILFNGTEYQLTQGSVTFSNPASIAPVIDLDAAARVRQYDITIGFHGNVDRPSITYRSDPPLPSSDIIALLALGRTHEEAVVTRQVTETPYDATSSALLAQALNLSLTSRVQKLFGVSRIKIDPQVGGPENNPNARLTIEQQVSNNVTLTYITNLSQSAQQIVQAEVAFTKAISVIAVRDQNGVLGFEIRIRQRKR
ncbi:MAG: translocation/assembly module TamB domain-containing protein [Terriglobales bacterium]